MTPSQTSAPVSRVRPPRPCGHPRRRPRCRAAARGGRQLTGWCRRRRGRSSRADQLVARLAGRRGQRGIVGVVALVPAMAPLQVLTDCGSAATKSFEPKTNTRAGAAAGRPSAAIMGAMALASDTWSPVLTTRSGSRAARPARKRRASSWRASRYGSEMCGADRRAARRQDRDPMAADEEGMCPPPRPPASIEPRTRTRHPSRTSAPTCGGPRPTRWVMVSASPGVLCRRRASSGGRGVGRELGGRRLRQLRRHHRLRMPPDSVVELPTGRRRCRYAVR